MKALCIAFILISCTQNKAKSASDFCRARAIYKAASSEELMSEPGSPRAKLEATEDTFCASLNP